MIWQLKDNEKYQFTRCKKCFNIKTGRLIKMTTNGGSIGYWIDKNFIVLNEIRNILVKIKKEKTPF